MPAHQKIGRAASLSMFKKIAELYKYKFSILLILFLAGALAFNFLTRNPAANTSEEEYVNETLNKLGWPAQAGGSSVFKPVSGQTYLPVRNFYKNQSLNLFGTYNTGKFTGFHTGVDIEVSSDDLYAEVPVYSFYDGVVRKVEWASGYGGVVIIEHNLGQIDLMGIYGHLRLKGVAIKEGERVTSGAVIGYLGNGYTNETDGERKHLHFGLYKGSVADIRGYVTDKKDLDAWLDPTRFMRGVSAKEVY